MPIEILMPALSPTMTEGNLARWLKKEGDEVHAGDVIAEIETDKATMEYEAVDEGRIGKIIVPEGAQGIKVNQPIAVLLEEGEDEAALTELGSTGPEAARAARKEVAVPSPNSRSAYSGQKMNAPRRRRTGSARSRRLGASARTPRRRGRGRPSRARRLF